MSDTSSDGGPEGQGWVDLVDAEKNVEVIFTDIPAVYSKEKDVTVHFNFIQGWSNQGDAICLFKTDASECRLRVLPVDLAVNSVTFSIADFPNDSTMFYQFIYVKAGGQSCGASTRFQIKPGPADVIDLTTEEAESEEEFLVIRTELQIENENLKKRVESFATTVIEMKKERALAEERLEKEIQSCQSEFERVQGELDVIKKEKADLISQVSVLKKKDLKQIERIKELESTIFEKDKKLNSDLKVILSYRATIQQLSKDRNLGYVVNPATTKFFRDALDEKQSMLKAVEASKKLLQEELDNEKLQCSKLHSSFKELEITCRDLQRCKIENEQNNIIIEDLQAENKKFGGELALNEEKTIIIEDLQAVNKKLEDKLALDNNENEARIKSLMMQCSELKQQMEESAVKESETIAQREAKYSELEQQLKDLEEDSAEKVKQMEIKYSNYEQSLQKIKDLMAIEQLAAKCSKFEEQLENQTKEVMAVETDAENLCCKENEKRIEDLKARLLEAGEIFKDQFRKIQQLEKDIKKYKFNRGHTPVSRVQLIGRGLPRRFSGLQVLEQYEKNQAAMREKNEAAMREKNQADVCEKNQAAVYVSDDEAQLKSPNAATASTTERVNDCDTGEPVEKVRFRMAWPFDALGRDQPDGALKVPLAGAKEKETFQAAHGQRGDALWKNLTSPFYRFSMGDVNGDSKSRKNDNVFPAKDNYSNVNVTTPVINSTRKVFLDSINLLSPPKPGSTNDLKEECSSCGSPMRPTVKENLSPQQKPEEKENVIHQLYPSLKDLQDDFVDDLDDGKCPRYTTPSPPPLYQPTNDIFTNQEKVKDKGTPVSTASHVPYMDALFAHIPYANLKEKICARYPQPPTSCLAPRESGMPQKSNTSMIFTAPTMFPSSGVVSATDVKNPICPKYVPQTPLPLIQLASDTLMNQRKLHGNVTNSGPVPSAPFSSSFAASSCALRPRPHIGTPVFMDNKNYTWPANGIPYMSLQQLEPFYNNFPLPSVAQKPIGLKSTTSAAASDEMKNGWIPISQPQAVGCPAQQEQSFRKAYNYPPVTAAQKPTGLKSTTFAAASDEMKSGWIPISHPQTLGCSAQPEQSFPKPYHCLITSATQKPVGLKSTNSAATGDEMKNGWIPISHPQDAGRSTQQEQSIHKAFGCPPAIAPQKPMGLKAATVADEKKNEWNASIYPEDVYHPECCPSCGQEVFVCKNDQSGMTDHLEIIHNQTLCPVCNGVFDMNPGGRKHFKRHVESHFH